MGEPVPPPGVKITFTLLGLSFSPPVGVGIAQAQSSFAAPTTPCASWLKTGSKFCAHMSLATPLVCLTSSAYTAPGRAGPRSGTC